MLCSKSNSVSLGSDTVRFPEQPFRILTMERARGRSVARRDSPEVLETKLDVFESNHTTRASYFLNPTPRIARILALIYECYSDKLGLPAETRPRWAVRNVMIPNLRKYRSARWAGLVRYKQKGPP